MFLKGRSQDLLGEGLSQGVENGLGLMWVLEIYRTYVDSCMGLFGMYRGVLGVWGLAEVSV